MILCTYVMSRENCIANTVKRAKHKCKHLLGIAYGLVITTVIVSTLINREKD